MCNNKLKDILKNKPVRISTAVVNNKWSPERSYDQEQEVPKHEMHHESHKTGRFRNILLTTESELVTMTYNSN